jgi:tetratricopeptide (TPR) repeat protein
MSPAVPPPRNRPQLPRALAEFMAYSSKLVISDPVAARYAKRVEQSPNHLWALLYVAEFQYRKREWQPAIEYASRALSLSPRSFQALMIVSASYWHLGERDKALPYAQSLLRAPPPRWSLTKFLSIVLLAPFLFLPAKRERLRLLLRECNRVRENEKAHLSWARELVEGSGGGTATSHVAA